MMRFICTYEKIKMIRIPDILLKYPTMHGKAMQVRVWPELLLQHFRTEYHVTMSVAITCLQSKYTARSINAHFIITRLKRNKKNMPLDLGQVKCHIAQARVHARAHTHTHTHTQQI